MFICFITVLAQNPVEWKTTSIQVKQGEDVQITCTMHDMGYFDVIRVVKEVGEGVQQDMKLADNSDLKPVFEQTKRYNVTYKKTGKTATLTINFKGEQDFNYILFSINFMKL